MDVLFLCRKGKDMIRERIAKLIDLKSIVTLILIVTLAFLIIYSVITGVDLNNNVFLLFSNIVTAVTTFYFSRKTDDKEKR